MIILVFVANENAEHTAANHLPYRVIWGMPRIIELLAKALGQYGKRSSLPIEINADIVSHTETGRKNARSGDGARDVSFAENRPWRRAERRKHSANSP